jgi:hypothetical protein
VIGEWENPFRIVSPAGTLTLNAAEGTQYRYLLDPAKCKATLPVRVTDDDVPQGSGKIPHRRWRGGYVFHLALELWANDKPACKGDLRHMLDVLGLHLNAMENTGLLPGAPEGRLIWTPSDTTDGADAPASDRMLTRAQLLSAPDASLEDGTTVVEFEIDSSFPYYMEFTQIETDIGDGDTVAVANPGNADFFPVIQAQGPSGGFSIINLDVLDPAGSPLTVTYDASLPGAVAIGGGDYLEIDFFRQTAYLNGSGANRFAGIDMRVSDFFPLAPAELADNNLQVGGADIVVKSNGAWA